MRKIVILALGVTLALAAAAGIILATMWSRPPLPVPRPPPTERPSRHATDRYSRNSSRRERRVGSAIGSVLMMRATTP